MHNKPISITWNFSSSALKMLSFYFGLLLHKNHNTPNRQLGGLALIDPCLTIASESCIESSTTSIISSKSEKEYKDQQHSFDSFSN